MAEEGNGSLSLVDQQFRLIRAAPNEQQCQEQVRALLDSLCGHLGVGAGKPADPLQTLADPTLSHEKRRFLAVCFLRLLDSRPECLQGPLRFAALKIFDDTLQEDVYLRLGIAERDQSYEKEGKLRGFVTRAEQDLKGTVDSLTDLHDLQHFRGRFMKAMHGPPACNVIAPFLPRDLADEQLRVVFKAVEGYLAAPVLEKLRAYEHADRLLGEFAAAARAHGTAYSEAFLLRVSDMLAALLKADFQNDPANARAQLSVAAFEKKYALWERERGLSIVFVVRNPGNGYAISVSLEVLESTLSFGKREHYIGSLQPYADIEVQVPCTVESPDDCALFRLRLGWTNLDGSKATVESDSEVCGQRRDVDWDSLSVVQPYSLEAIRTEKRFIGRTETLGALEALATGVDGVTSSLIYGQRRIGKTSIAKVLKDRLERNHPGGFLVVYLESGDFADPTPSGTINSLGRILVGRMRHADNRFAGLEEPVFSGALSPVSPFLERIHAIAPELRVVVILDEFDELPAALYKRSPEANAFFLTLRSVSAKGPFGFVLVGGEKMEYVLSCQGDVLNKFRPVRIDHFDRQKHWADYCDLVRAPVAAWLEVTDDAVAALHETTSGNPFFTNLICQNIFACMVDRRDGHVTRREVAEAELLTLGSAESNIFQHFWEDGLVEEGALTEERSVIRRQVLLCLADALRHDGVASEKVVANKCRDWGIAEQVASAELREFERRKVCVRTEEGYRCCVPLFERWLREKGYSSIVTSLMDVTELARLKEQQERERVSSQEIVDLVGAWGPFRGRTIGTDQVRAWLVQFGGPHEQRQVFSLLKRIRYYGGPVMRQKLREAHDIAQRGTVWILDGTKRKRGDILVSGLDGLGKSGSHLARIYADENDLYKENVVERSAIVPHVQRALADHATVSLVFVDDIIATGTSACDYLDSLFAEQGEPLRELCGPAAAAGNAHRLRLYLTAVCALDDGLERVKRHVARNSIPVEVHACDVLGAGDRCFSESSTVFGSEEEKLSAMALCQNYGRKLVAKNPLGFGDCQLLVVFEHNCPNNTIPILWESRHDFRALFERY